MEMGRQAPLLMYTVWEHIWIVGVIDGLTAAVDVAVMLLMRIGTAFATMTGITVLHVNWGTLEPGEGALMLRTKSVGAAEGWWKVGVVALSRIKTGIKIFPRHIGIVIRYVV